ncbi:MAG: 50S ribosomal protein L25/general stress protein Ctc [Actinomycetaceae bacterium]|nr:50S ribosomal protein L25/general stress protein Ctc [Actinomycetaceae bacterium]
MAATKLNAEKRTEFGKGASRRARREGKIPAVIYGGETETQSLVLPGHDTFLIVKDGANALVELHLDGEKQLALVKDVQRHPVRRDILHVDLLAVKRGEKVEVDIPVVLVGEPEPGTTATLDEFTLTVMADATAIPEEIEVSIEGLENGTVVTFKDITLPEGTEADYEDDTVICSIAIPQEEAPAAADAEGSEAEAGESSDEGGNSEDNNE